MTTRHTHLRADDPDEPVMPADEVRDGILDCYDLDPTVWDYHLPRLPRPVLGPDGTPWYDRRGYDQIVAHYLVHHGDRLPLAPAIIFSETHS